MISPRARGDGRLPLVMLGGFLGAGKTTWLRHQLYEGQFARHHILVNEAAETPVDNLLLGQARRIGVLAGGCACCDARDEMLAALRAICDDASGKQAGEIDGILLETSGLADPGAIAAALAADPVLARRLVLTETRVLVDALHGAVQLAAEPLSRAQVEAADQVIITKPGLVSPEALSRLAATLRALNPAAPVSSAEQGLPVPLPDMAAPPFTLPPLAGVTPIRPYRLNIGAGGDNLGDHWDGGWIAFSTWLSALLHARGDDIVRIKGVVRTPAGRLLLQSVRRTVQPPEVLPDGDAMPSGPLPQDGVIVMIGRNIDGEALKRSWARFGA